MKKEIKDFIPKGFEIDESRKIENSEQILRCFTNNEYIILNVPVKRKK